ncbi:MAG TPA: alpha-1,2-fucosyltransferase [Candidatus Coprenecus stercoravium]|uniref:Alpha-1,2-fucosyltransferase n=1 Tax=Candidatus Coprenecus stercoravium TaxID=2840735 RepID=A0A9D2K849_9BACT|nr:alpha-1,2-fucosyltransferase [Candidatus Coprenecus stercoravium]
MMLCNHFIIPNSTYPYWAALLSNTNQNKIVIAPKIWYKGQQPNTKNSILPSDWIAI